MQTLTQSVRSFLAQRVVPKADSPGNRCSRQNAKLLSHTKPCGQRVRPLALMLHLKIYDLQWKETQEASSSNILLLRPGIPESERGSDLPNASRSEPAPSLAFLLLPCIARAQVNFLYSEEKLQGPKCECKSSADPPLQLLREFNQMKILISNVPWAFRGRREGFPGRLKLESLFPGAEMWAWW